MQYQCERRDLRAVVSVPSFWYVDGNGTPEDYDIDGDRDHNPCAESYTCFECGADFIPQNVFDCGALEEAWQAALAHLQKQEAAL
jgi:hypothetical protein